MDFSGFDKTGSERLYLKIRGVILKAIRERDLLPRQKVPSLKDLSEMTGVSRMTVRQALQELVNEGWLYTVPGKGTFVAEKPRIEQNLHQLMGWTDEIRMQGMVPSSRLISCETIPISSYMAEWLQVPTGTLVYRVTRVRYANAFALALERAHLVYAKYPGLEQWVSAESSLYQSLKDHYYVQPVRAIEFIDANEADQSTAQLLDIETGKCVVISERISYTASNEPIELVIGVHKPGFVRFKTELNVNTPPMRQITVSPEEYTPLKD